MNPAEKERQIKVMKEKYRKENQTSFDQFKESMSKRASAMLSKTVLPLLKRTKEEPKQVDEPAVSTAGPAEERNPADTQGISMVEEDDAVVIQCDSPVIAPM